MFKNALVFIAGAATGAAVYHFVVAAVEKTVEVVAENIAS